MRDVRLVVDLPDLRPILDHGQIVRLRRLDRYLCIVETRLKQNLPDIFRVDPSTLPLVGARALNLDQHDRPNVLIGFGAMRVRRSVELVEAVEGRVQGRAPVGALPRIQIEGHLDHALAVDLPPRHLDEEVGIASGTGILAAPLRYIARGRGQFEDETRVESIQCAEGQIGYGPVSLVEHDHGPDDPQGIAERVLHHGEHAAIGVQVWRGVQRRLMRLLVTLRRKETVYVAAVLEHLEGVFGFPVRRLEHQQHDARRDSRYRHRNPVKRPALPLL